MLYLRVDTDVSGGTGSGLTWDNACASVALAIAELPAIFDDDYTILCRCTSGTANTTAIMVEGKDYNGNTLTIQAEEGYRANKEGWDDTAFSVVVDQADWIDNCIRVTLANTIIDGLQVKFGTNRDNALGYGAIHFSGHNLGQFVRNCRISIGTNDSGGISGILQATSSSEVTVENCIIEGYAIGIVGRPATTTTFMTSRHCIVKDCAVGMRLTTDNNMYVRNSAVFDCTDDFLNDALGTLDIDHCASDDGDGTNAVAPSGAAWSNEFQDTLTGDFTLLPDGNLYSGGVVISGGYAYDMEGDLWDTTSPSIGVDEYIAPPPKRYPRFLFGP